MKFDIFFSICQTEVDGYMPTERVMFENYFDQLKLADELGFGVAWIAETHLSCEIQKTGPLAVTPHFKGEIGLNTDILQMAHKVFAMTERIEVGSAIRNIFCNGGPIAHAEAIRTFLSLHGFDKNEKRRLHIGFASGRFDFSNRPYGIIPRDEVEKSAWPVVKGKAMLDATEKFLRLLSGEQISSADVAPQILRAEDFRSPEEWARTVKAYGRSVDEIPLTPFWTFERVGVIPFDSPMELLTLTLGSHDPKAQILANQIRPVGVFNLSITPPAVIEETHERMRQHFHKKGGPWRREYMPRTAMVFLNNDAGVSSQEQTRRAKASAEKAWINYWKAMEGTLDAAKVAQAVENTLAGSPDVLAEQIRKKYHPEDRLMLWFDFNNHNNAEVKQAMRDFMEHVAPQLN